MKKLDLQDVLIVAGFLTFESGVAAIYWPAALILAGLMFFSFALLIERSQRIAKREALAANRRQ